MAWRVFSKLRAGQRVKQPDGLRIRFPAPCINARSMALANKVMLDGSGTGNVDASINHLPVAPLQ